jgi:lipopolysaccharide/colanic/teichoic acid biosynthesis glycosyltransferase
LLSAPHPLAGVATSPLTYVCLSTPRVYLLAKRVLDVALSLAAIIVFLPLWVGIAVAIKLTSPGPVFYVTESLAMGGRPFRLYKFRTMEHRADERIHREFIASYVRENKPFAVEIGPDGERRSVFKVVNDPRVTPFGRLLRRSGLDEAPQFINVLRGEMSIVGPRSPRPFEYEHYQEWHKQRLTVPQGITGLYQVTARSRASFDDMVRIDLEYIRRRSLWLDLRIIGLTIPVMLFGKGGY